MKMYKKGCENIKKYKFKIIIPICISLLVIFSGLCFAKYNISQNIINTYKVAIPVLEVKESEITKISAINKVGYYDFIVKNYNSNNISDVAQKYTIEIISNTDESINFELYKDEKMINLINNKTEEIYIEGTKEVEHSYRLKVTYEKEKSNSEQDILEDIQIKIHSEQSKV